MRTTTFMVLVTTLAAACAASARADDTAMTPLQVPAKTLQVPSADISPEMQKFIAAPLNPGWNFHPKTGEEWRAMANKIADGVVPGIPAMLDRLHVKMEPATIDGVKVFVLTPDEIRPPTATRSSSTCTGAATSISPASRARRRPS